LVTVGDTKSLSLPTTPGKPWMLLLLLTLRKLHLPLIRYQLINSFAEEFDGERIKAPILLMPSSGEDMDVVSLSILP
jgi:hypothetical protein